VDSDMSDREDFQVTTEARASVLAVPDAAGLAFGGGDGGRTPPAGAFREGRLDRACAISQILTRIAALPPDSPVLDMIAGKL
jgi:hypothetical protein